MAFNKAVDIFIAKDNLGWTKEGWKLNLQKLKNDLIEVANGTVGESKDDLPF